jgi:cytochrome c oxidase subunit 4
VTEAAETRGHEAREHPGPTVYLVVAAFLALLTVMELVVFYVPALRPVLVPVLIILGAAKFALVAMFYMHLKYEGWLLTSILVFPLLIATILVVALLVLFLYLGRHAYA